MSPRQAFLGPQEAVPVGDAVGRIAAESLAAYPPGIPNVLPGERLTAATLDYIHTTLDHGGILRGASDRKLRDDQGGDRVTWGVEDETSPLRDVLLGPSGALRVAAHQRDLQGRARQRAQAHPGRLHRGPPAR